MVGVISFVKVIRGCSGVGISRGVGVIAAMEQSFAGVRGLSQRNGTARRQPLVLFFHAFLAVMDLD